MAFARQQVVTDEWVTFPGGELEGKRPKALCQACRASGTANLSRRLCFDCYRADLARERALKAAADLDTASDARFQTQLPFEPVNRARLDSLKAHRAEARVSENRGIGQYADRRRQAQIQARHALQTIAAGLRERQLAPAAQARVMADAARAAELQLPEAWLPYVVSR